MTAESLIPFIRSGALSISGDGSKLYCHLDSFTCSVCPIGPYTVCYPLRTSSSSISQLKELVPEYFL